MRHREGGGGQRHRQREKQALCKEPNMGLDPGSPGSRPGPKAGAKPLRHPGIPIIGSIISNQLCISEMDLIWSLCTFSILVFGLLVFYIG